MKYFYIPLPQMEAIRKYFPGLTAEQDRQFSMLQELYANWNAQINVISRKDIDNLEERHILHSLAIARIIRFKPGTRVMDVGTGGGFPGIPLAIMFPEAHFTLVDSIGKKIKVVKEIAQALGLRNVSAIQARAEDMQSKYDFITSRAVARLPVFVKWVKKKISAENNNSLNNGILYLKGGDIDEELNSLQYNYVVYDIDINFPQDFFNGKKLVYIPISQ